MAISGCVVVNKNCCYSDTFLTAENAEVAEHSFFFFSLKGFSLRSAIWRISAVNSY